MEVVVPEIVVLIASMLAIVLSVWVILENRTLNRNLDLYKEMDRVNATSIGGLGELLSAYLVEEIYQTDTKKSARALRTFQSLVALVNTVEQSLPPHSPHKGAELQGVLTVIQEQLRITESPTTAPPWDAVPDTTTVRT